MANDYDNSSYLKWTRKFEYYEERIINGLINDFNGIVCDIGCGTGRYALKLTKFCKVIGIDISIGMLKVLKSKCNAKNLHLIVGDGENLPLKSNAIDGIICTFTIDHFNSHNNGVKEFHRVLKLGGKCILSIFNRKTMEDVLIRLKIPYGYVRFQTKNCPPTLIEEKFLYYNEAIEIFSKYFKIIDKKSACFWHLFPIPNLYPPFIDKFLNNFDKFHNFAELFIFKLHKS